MPFVKKLLQAASAFFMLLCRVFPVNRKKVLFVCYHGTGYDAGGKAITEYLLAQHAPLELVWAASPGVRSKLPEGVRYVKYHTLAYLFELATAGVWIDNCRKPYWVRKRKDQLYIQIWHGPICIKAVEKDAKDALDDVYLASAVHDSLMADYIVAEAKWREANILKSFWYSGPLIRGEFKPEGMANASLIREELDRRLHLDPNCHLALYVPTFRKDGSDAHYIHDYRSVLKALRETWGGEWKLIVRMHPNVLRSAESIAYDSDILNGTGVLSAELLIYASDLVISDYSGCIFYAFRQNKPVILYGEDYEEYRTSDRQLYFAMDELPSPMAKNMTELLSAIGRFDPEQYRRRCDELNAYLGYYEADAAELCAEKILAHASKGRN